MHLTEIKITPAQREREKRAELKERRFQASIDFEIKDEILQMNSPDAKEKVLKENRLKGPAYESYARPIIEAADRWGRLMQVRMKRQHLKKLTPELVSKTQAYFGDWGVRAPLFLMSHWVYGKQLRQCLIENLSRQGMISHASDSAKKSIKIQKTRD